MGAIKAAPRLTSLWRQKLTVGRIACFYLKRLQLTMASVNHPWLEGRRPWGSKDGHACLQPFCLVPLLGRDLLSLLPFYVRMSSETRYGVYYSGIVFVAAIVKGIAVGEEDLQIDFHTVLTYSVPTTLLPPWYWFNLGHSEASQILLLFFTLHCGECPVSI